MAGQKITQQYNIINPTNDIDRLLYKHGTSEYNKQFIEIGEEKTVMPIAYLKIAEKIENFEIRDTDVWVITYPKTG